MAHEVKRSFGVTIGLAAALAACSTLEPCPTPPLYSPGNEYSVFFASGDTALSGNAIKLIGVAAESIKPDGYVSVVGHADGAGSAEANLLLSYRRAKVVGKALADAGVDPARITIESRGSDQLLVRTPKSEPQNRRVQLVVTQAGTREPRFREEYIECISAYTRFVPLKPAAQ
jgi:OmpA-OmpF porin, OOP family